MRLSAGEAAASEEASRTHSHPPHPEPAETGSSPVAVRRASEVHDALAKVRHVCERRRDVRRQCLARTTLAFIFNILSSDELIFEEDVVLDRALQNPQQILLQDGFDQVVPHAQLHQ